MMYNRRYERDIVPTALEIRPEQRDVTVRARPSLPKHLRDDQMIRMEIRDTAETVLWHTDIPVHQAREQLNSRARLVTFIIPATIFRKGMCTLNLSDGHVVPFFRATVAIAKARANRSVRRCFPLRPRPERSLRMDQLATGARSTRPPRLGSHPGIDRAADAGIHDTPQAPAPIPLRRSRIGLPLLVLPPDRSAGSASALVHLSSSQ